MYCWTTEIFLYANSPSKNLNVFLEEKKKALLCNIALQKEVKGKDYHVDRVQREKQKAFFEVDTRFVSVQHSRGECKTIGKGQ